MNRIELKCHHCNSTFSKEQKEYRRRLKAGAVRFFCSLSCTVKTKNFESRSPVITENRKCLCCGVDLLVTFKEGEVGRRHCSLSCASLNSVTPKRLEASRLSGLKSENRESLNEPYETLKKREAWKYERLKVFLDNQKISYEFEKLHGDYVFDLAIPDTKQYVEFDGSYHSSRKQKEKDKIKDDFAFREGWNVLRIKVETNAVIPAEVLYSVLKKE